MDQAFTPFVDRCQLLALRLPGVDPASGFSELAALVDSLPAVPGEAGQAVLFRLLIRLLAGAVVRAGVSDEREVTRRFFKVTMLSGPASEWLVEFSHLIRSCASLVQGRTALAPRSAAEIVRRILQLIDERFADRHLNLQEAAQAAGCSISYASRILIDATGRGFTEHLRERRIASAKELLVQTSFAMKEVASAAGFGNASGFSRQFKQVEGRTPTMYRRARRHQSTR